MEFKDLEKLKTLVNTALNLFYSNDSILLDFEEENRAVSERSLVFRIGIYLQNLMLIDDYFNDFNIDAEYNRNFEHPKSMYKITLEGIREKIKDTYPDLLIHKRRRNDSNLLIIEFKKGQPTSSQKNDDVQKLLYFTDIKNEYKYVYGFYIQIHRGKSKVEVYHKGKHLSHLDYEYRIGRN